MILYKIGCKDLSTHYLDIEISFSVNKETKTVEVQLPAWRPGRYELGNFAKNIRNWQACNEQGQPLESRKINKDLWEIQAGNTTEITISYRFFAYSLTAGNTFVDDQQLYVNPVNCLLYLPGRIEEPCVVTLNVPPDYEVATALKKQAPYKFTAPDFDRLADSPFIASPHLQHDKYEVGETVFHLWFMGTIKPDWERIKEHFKKFTEEHLVIYETFPFKEYHFLYQVPAIEGYHGVEHLDSTVILLGPGYSLMDGDKYEEFLSISCHELFHAWNIKSIRPAGMYPYDFSKENYSALGYVAEGVTTYYGYYLLLRCGNYSWETFVKKFNALLERHFHNFGRRHYSVAQSSFDTWLDGYEKGTPDRKVSIYVEGALINFMLDISIRSDSSNHHSLDSVMRYLYTEFAQQGRGYTEEDYLSVINNFTGSDYRWFFEKYIWGTEPFDDILQEKAGYIGCRYAELPAEHYAMRKWGVKLTVDKDRVIVDQIAPDCPARAANISVEDEILAINDIRLSPANQEGLFKAMAEGRCKVILSRKSRILQMEVNPTQQNYYGKPVLEKLKNPNEQLRNNFKLWAKQEFYEQEKSN